MTNENPFFSAVVEKQPPEPQNLREHYNKLAQKRMHIEDEFAAESDEILSVISDPWPRALPINDFKIFIKTGELRKITDDLSKAMERADELTDNKDLLALYLETKPLIGRIRLWPTAIERLHQSQTERSESISTKLSEMIDTKKIAEEKVSKTKWPWQSGPDLEVMDSAIARLTDKDAVFKNTVWRSKHSYFDFDEQAAAGYEAKHARILTKAVDLWARKAVKRYDDLSEQLIPIEKRRELDTKMGDSVLKPAFDEAKNSNYAPATDTQINEFMQMAKKVLESEPPEQKPSNRQNIFRNVNPAYLEFDQWINRHSALSRAGYLMNLEAYDGYPAQCYRDLSKLLCRESVASGLEKFKQQIAEVDSYSSKKTTEVLDKLLKGDKQSWNDDDRRGISPNAIPIEDFLKIQGLARLSFMKQDEDLLQTFPSENFETLKDLIIRRLVDEALVPGGTESWPGTNAAGNLNQMGAPEALPLLLRHIQKTGYGHTNTAVLHTIKCLLDSADPKDLEQALRAATDEERQILALIQNKHSYFNRYTESVSQCLSLNNGNFLIYKEKLTAMMAENNFTDTDLEEFYRSTNSFDFSKTMEYLRRLSTASGVGLRTLAEPLFSHIIRTLSPDAKYSEIVCEISQIRGEPLAQTFAIAEKSLRDKNISCPIIFAEELLSLCEEVGLDSAPIMENYIDQISKNLSWFTFGLPEIVEAFSSALKQTPWETYERIRKNMKDNLIGFDAIKTMEKIAEVCSVPKQNVIVPLLPQITKNISAYDPNSINELEKISEITEMDFESIVLSCGTKFFSPSRNPIMSRLCSPQDGAIERAPIAIAKNMQIDPNLLEALKTLYASKRLQRGGMERVMMLEGLGFLHDKDLDGQLILERLLSMVKGTKDDPDNFRKILQYLQILDSLSEFNLPEVNTEALQAIDAEMSDLQNRLNEITDKKERKKLTNRLETLKQKKNTLEGLKGTERVLHEKIIDIVCEKLQLSADMREIVDRDFDKLSQSGLLNIVPTLTGRYSSIGAAKTSKLLAEATEHIIKQDFHEWKYNVEYLQAQLSCYGDEERAIWVANAEPSSPPATKEILPENHEYIWNALSSVISNALDHYRTNRPKVLLGGTGEEILKAELEAAELKTSTAQGESAKKIAILNRDKAKHELTICTGLLYLSSANAESLADEKSFKQKILDLQTALESLGGMGDLSTDIRQMLRILETEIKGGFTITETDDPMSLLNVGVEPIETCQSWRKGSYNECLMAYVADANKKILNVSSSDGSVFARSIFTALAERPKISEGAEQDTPLLFLERIYALHLPSAVQKELLAMALRKAVSMHAKLGIAQLPDENNNLLVLQELAESFGYTISYREANIMLPPSRNVAVYSDSFGGKLLDTSKPITKTLYIFEPKTK